MGSPHAQGMDESRPPEGLFRSVVSTWSDRTSDHWIVLVGLAALGGLLGRSGLAPSSLWRDDAWVALVQRAPLHTAIHMGVTSPGFSIALREWLAVVGYSELRAQLPAYAASVLAPPLLYLLALRLRLRWPTALLAAVLLATSVPFIGVTDRVKPYSVGVLGAIIMMWIGWRVVEQPRVARRWAYLAIAAVGLTIMTAAVIGAVVGAFAVAIVAAWQAGALLRRHVAGAVAGYALFATGWWIAVLSHATTPSLKVSFGGAMIPAHAGQSRWAGIYARLSDLVGHFTPLTLHHAGAALVLLAVALLVATARRPLVLLLVVAPVAIAVVLALRRIAPLGGGGPITVNGSRVDVYLYPSLALLFAAVVEDILSLAAELRLAHRLVAPAVAFLLVAGLVATASRGAYPEEDTKSLIRSAEAAAAPGDSIVVQTDARYQYALYTRWPIQVILSRRFESGFTVDVQHRDIIVMGGGSQEDGNSDSAVLGLVPPTKPPSPPTTSRVFVVTSRFYSAPTGVDKWLSSGGYHQVMNHEMPGAALELWTG